MSVTSREGWQPAPAQVVDGDAKPVCFAAMSPWPLWQELQSELAGCCVGDWWQTLQPVSAIPATMVVALECSAARSPITWQPPPAQAVCVDVCEAIIVVWKSVPTRAWHDVHEAVFLVTSGTRGALSWQTAHRPLGELAWTPTMPTLAGDPLPWHEPHSATLEASVAEWEAEVSPWKPVWQDVQRASPAPMDAWMTDPRDPS